MCQLAHCEYVCTIFPCYVTEHTGRQVATAVVYIINPKDKNNVSRYKYSTLKYLLENYLSVKGKLTTHNRKEHKCHKLSNYDNPMDGSVVLCDHLCSF